MVRKLDIVKQSEAVRSTAENVFSDGGFFKPMIGVFKDGVYQGAVIMRNPKDDDAEDRKCAFAEACMLIRLLEGDEAVVSFDSFVTRLEEGVTTTLEAINVMIASDKGAEAVMMPYSRDEEGKFSKWLRQEESDDINPSGLSGNMIATLAHYMNNYSKLEYPELMMRSMSKRGHMVLLPGGKNYVEGVLSENVEETAERLREQVSQ
jgi:hypothetical protein